MDGVWLVAVWMEPRSVTAAGLSDVASAQAAIYTLHVAGMYFVQCSRGRKPS